jgi:hypothetical protein
LAEDALSPAAHYAARRAHFASQHAQAQRMADRVSDLRLAVFAGGLGIAGAWWMGWLVAWWLLAPLVLFVALVAWHEVIHRRLTHAALGMELYDTWTAALEGHPRPSAFEALVEIPAGHRYARDLDLFGRGGMFELIGRTRTAIGAQTLASWLLSPAPRDEVLQRQEAVRELAHMHALREALALESGAVQAAVSAQDLRHWAGRPACLDARPRIIPAALLSLIAAAAIPAIYLYGIAPFVLVLAINGVYLSTCRNGLRELDASLEPISKELRVLGAVLHLLEEAPFASPLLREHQACLRQDGERASMAVRKLERLVSGYETYQNQFFLPFAIFLLWPFWWGVAIERWRARHREALRHTWLDALGQLEALCSIAGYAFERPEDTWPELDASTTRFEADALGHPLLPRGQRVHNSICLGPGQRLLMVSGSNMSGKSTLLRAIGINAVLAQMGAPVCASRLALSPMQMGAVIRVEDSLQRGASRFYAEIERFKLLLDAARATPPLLFLADEILHGTNTRDRVIGAQALIRALLQHDAIGLVTTHDLALTEFVAQVDEAVNVHFQDDIVDGRLAFDYTLRPGVVTKSNALDLMRAVGLPVD